MTEGGLPKSTVDRELHYFKVGTGNYSVSLVKANYSGLDASLTFTTTPPGGNVEVIAMTIGRALKEGLLFPLKVRGKKGTKKASATIYVPRDKIEEAFKNLIGKNYGAMKISEVSPVLKRLVSA